MEPSHADESSVAAMINGVRRANGVAKVVHDDDFRLAGRRWSLRTARTGAFVHTGLEWTGGRPVGENVAMAPSAQRAVEVQLESRPHRRNLLKRAWRSVGVGVAARGDGMLFVTVTLAS